MLNFFILACLALLFSENKSAFILQAGLTIFFVGFIYYLNVDIEKKLFITTNNYANYAIRETKNSS